MNAVRGAVADACPALVINPAAYTAVDRAEDDAETAFAINRDGARHVAAAAAEAGVPVIHFSTAVFDGTKGAPYVESDPRQAFTGAPNLLGAGGRGRQSPQTAIAR
jgi:dTDP-4-dehydrorhamnose reductase